MPRTRRARPTALLERLGVADRAGDKVETLSLGNQQRVQLAAALVHDPELLVLDEPFSGLDPVGVDVLGEVLRRAAPAPAWRSCSPATSSSWWSGCATAWRSSTAARLVAGGTVDELRASRAADRWSVQLAGAEPEVVSGTDPDAILDAARARGTVVAFGRVRPTLAELFRESVEA